jgi:hypothetical protein
MAKIRNIKPDFWTSEQVVSVSIEARTLFIGLWNHADDNGIFPASYVSIKMKVFPNDNLPVTDQPLTGHLPVTYQSVSSMINDLIRVGLLAEYEVDGKKYWIVTGWDHQGFINKPFYKYPPPKGELGKKYTFYPKDCSKFDNSHLPVTDCQLAGNLPNTWESVAEKEKEKEKEKEQNSLLTSLRDVNCVRVQNLNTNTKAEEKVQNLNDSESENIPAKPEKKTENQTVVAREELKSDVLPDGCPHKEIIKLYHEILPEGTRVEHWTQARAQNLRTRWREKKAHQSLKFWERFFVLIRCSAFLMGKVASAGRRPYQISLDKIITPSMFYGIVEFKYHDKDKGELDKFSLAWEAQKQKGDKEAI